MSAERLLTEGGLEARTIPRPLDFGGECGVAVRVPVELAPEAEQRLASAGFTIACRGPIRDT